MCRKMAELGVYYKKGKEYFEEMVTEVQLKKLLWQLRAEQIQDSLLEECLISKESTHGILQYSDRFQFKIIEQTLNILSPNEKFVIETHLIDHQTWTETTRLFHRKNTGKTVNGLNGL